MRKHFGWGTVLAVRSGPPPEKSFRFARDFIGLPTRGRRYVYRPPNSHKAAMTNVGRKRRLPSNR
jgi:hypothetical protein